LGAVALILIGREAGNWLWLFGEARVVYTDGCSGAVLAPPLDDLLEKRVFWASGKEVAVEVACLRVKQDENRHRARFWERWGVHGTFGFPHYDPICFGYGNLSVIFDRSLRRFSPVTIDIGAALRDSARKHLGERWDM
jgi:hypothetical protein